MDRAQRSVGAMGMGVMVVLLAAGAARADESSDGASGPPSAERSEAGGVDLQLRVALPGGRRTLAVTGTSVTVGEGLSLVQASAALAVGRLHLAGRFVLLELDGDGAPERRTRVDLTPSVALDVVGVRAERAGLYIRIEAPLSLQLVNPRNSGGPARYGSAGVGLQLALGVRAALSRTLSVSVEAGPATRLASIDPARAPTGHSLFGAVLATCAL